MTYDDFIDLANNPPRKEQDCVFELTQFTIDELPYKHRQHYPEYSVSKECRTYFHSAEEAESFMQALFRESDLAEHIFCFYLRELPYNINICAEDECVSCRVYDASGKLIEQSLCSNIYADGRHYCNFRGRPEPMIRFHEGEIVEVLCDNRVTLAIVAGTPSTPNQAWNYRQTIIEHMANFYKKEPDTAKGYSDAQIEECYRQAFGDDSYLVLDASDGHSHPHSTCVFSPHFHIPPYIRQRYESYYRRMEQKCQNRKWAERAVRLTKELYPNTFKKLGE